MEWLRFVIFGVNHKDTKNTRAGMASFRKNQDVRSLVSTFVLFVPLWLHRD
jgi:hypothetical protein